MIEFKEAKVRGKVIEEKQTDFESQNKNTVHKEVREKTKEIIGEFKPRGKVVNG